MNNSNRGAKRPDKNTAGSDKNARSAIQACSVRKNWVEIEHSTTYPNDYNQAEPAANTEYCLTLGDGSKIEGILDANGFARHDDIPDGNISVQYEPEIDEVVKTLKKQLQTELNGLVQIEHDEYAKIEKEFQNAKLFGLDFPGSNTIAKAYMVRDALRKGVWNGITGLLGFAWDLVKGAGKVLYEVGLRTNPLTAPRKFKEDLAELKEKHDEFQRFKDEDLEAYIILMSDPDVYGMFMQYGKDIIKAQHLLEYLEASGEIGLDIALTIVTAGVGAASNARHLAKLKKLKALIDKLVTALKKKAHRKKNHKDKPNKKVVTKNNMQENGAKNTKLPPTKNKYPNAKEIELDSKGRFRDKHGKSRTNAGPNAPDFKKWKENGGTVKYDDATDTVIYGKMVKTSKGKEPIEVPYKKGPPDNQRYPDFSDYGEQQVNIKMTGKKEIDINPPEGGDFSNAWEALEKQKGKDEVHKYGIKRRVSGKRSGVYENKNPRGKTWHHVQDGKTMQLIDSSIHSTFTHKGGASLSQ